MNQILNVLSRALFTLQCLLEMHLSLIYLQLLSSLLCLVEFETDQSRLVSYYFLELGSKLYGMLSWSITSTYYCFCILIHAPWEPRHVASILHSINKAFYLCSNGICFRGLLSFINWSTVYHSRSIEVCRDQRISWRAHSLLWQFWRLYGTLTLNLVSSLHCR